MQYISFYKNRLPFKPQTNVIIYFDVTGIGMKRYYSLISEYYDRIVEEFRRGGLEFCFLPKIAHDMDLKKIYRYFNPQADPNDFIPQINLYKDSDLLEYIVAGYDARHLNPGLIQYMGEDFDKEDTYTYEYTPLSHFESSPISLIKLYVDHHGFTGNLFESENSIIEKRVETGVHYCGAIRKSSNIAVCKESLKEPSVEDMMSEVQMLVERLRQSGVGEIALQRLFKPDTDAYSCQIITIWRLRCILCQKPSIYFSCVIPTVSVSPTCLTTVMNLCTSMD